MVVLRCDNHDAELRAREYLEKQVVCCVIKSKTASRGAVELNIEVRLADDNTDFINFLSSIPGVESAVAVSYNGDYMD